MLGKSKNMGRKMPAQVDQSKDFLGIDLNQDPKIGFHPSITKKETRKKGGKK